MSAYCCINLDLLLTLHSFFWVIPHRLNFVCRRFGTSCSIFIGCVSRKNNRDEIVGVFIWEKVWFKEGLSQSGGGGTGRGHVRVEKQAVKDVPKCRPQYVTEKWYSSPLFFLLTAPTKMEQTVFRNVGI